MHAVVVEKFGGHDQLKLQQVPRPGGSARQLVVAIAAAAVNPVDASNRADGTWAHLTPPFIPGSDASGVVVEAAGGGVDFGDVVVSFSGFLGGGGGTYAEFQADDAAIVARKPAGLTFPQAAAVPLAGGTAYELVVRRTAVRQGEIVVIVGAAGAVGSFAVQLARNAGARVAAVARADDDEYLRSLGAELTFDHRSADVFGDVGAAVGEVDVVIDVVGGDTVARATALVRPGGRIATACEFAGDLDLSIDKNLTLHGVLVRPERARLEALAKLYDAGALQPPLIRAELPLSAASKSHRLIESGRGRGKIVLVNR
jgi:NADPH2:quinone reductase